MTESVTDLKALLHHPRFPRSTKYDPQWIKEGLMGPSALWLTEWLCEALDLRPGMRVLDMGCGRAMSSIYLAREFGVQVWANDLWIKPTENWQRIQAAGVADRVFPIRAEAHQLPYAHGFFDAIVSVDAYHYFGTDDTYLPNHLAPLAKRGAPIAIVVPGLMREFETDADRERLLTRARWDGGDIMTVFHTAAWWQRHWQRSRCVDVQRAEALEDGWKFWVSSDLAWHGDDPESQMLREDAGHYMGLVRIVARTLGAEGRPS
jgi:cyclopropane fatty-acyl-phospholipid synthase-like methyltransferase